MPRGGKREGAGRPDTKKTDGANLNVRLTAQDVRTLGGYPHTRAVELLASGLRLGAGNVGELGLETWALLEAATEGTVLDALTVRHLADEVADLEHPDAAGLATQMRTWGDWECLHVVLALEATREARRILKRR